MQDKNIHTVYLGENYGALVQVPSEIHVIDPQRAGKVLNIFKVIESSFFYFKEFKNFLHCFSIFLKKFIFIIVELICLIKIKI